jgi:hypothetical protein
VNLPKFSPVHLLPNSPSFRLILVEGTRRQIKWKHGVRVNGVEKAEVYMHRNMRQGSSLSKWRQRDRNRREECRQIASILTCSRTTCNLDDTYINCNVSASLRRRMSVNPKMSNESVLLFKFNSLLTHRSLYWMLDTIRVYWMVLSDQRKLQVSWRTLQ